MSSATGDVPQDLVVVALGGVQRFIGESRTTADLAAASDIMAALARTAAEACGAEPGTALVFPEHTGTLRGAPNRVVALVPAGEGPRVAAQAAKAVREAWAERVARTFGAKQAPAAGWPAPGTPGMPDVTWVSVPAGEGDYATRWKLAQRALAARRGVRDFIPADEARQPLCSLSPRWVSSPPPPRARKHHREERLSRVNWTRRQWGRLPEDPERQRFASTYAISSAAFRRAVAERLGDPEVSAALQALRTAAAGLPRARETPVPGFTVGDTGSLGDWLAESAGSWIYPGRWTERTLADELAADGTERSASELVGITAGGRSAAQHLVGVMKERGVPGPAIYLAVVAQDLDGMGEFLSGIGAARDGRRIPVTAASHEDVSRRLLRLGADQVERLSSRELLGVPVYAGGDDLLAFAPAATALAVAETAYEMVPADLPTASTAVLFFHQHASLRQAIIEVQALLHQAKHNVEGKDALAVGFLRRSGVREESIQPWRSPATGDLTVRSFALLGTEGEHTLSPRLVADLERDADELETLPPRIYAAELSRLVERHTGGEHGEARRGFAADAARGLADLGVRESSQRRSGEAVPRPVPLARVGVFLRQEAR